MSAIEIRSEFIRIAHAFTAGATGVFDIEHLKHGHAVKNIYVEPHASGKGVQIVSTDGGCMCVQWDREGHVDRPYLICGLTRPDTLDMSGSNISERWLVGSPEKLSIRQDIGPKYPTKRLSGVTACKVRLRDEATDEPGVTVYPNWRSHLPSREDIDSMSEGYPGFLNAAYLSIIARLYDDGMQNCRGVRVLHKGSIESPVLLQFPWRNDLFVLIAPQTPSISHGWTDMIHDVVSTTRSLKARAEDDDPAAGL